MFKVACDDSLHLFASTTYRSVLLVQTITGKKVKSAPIDLKLDELKAHHCRRLSPVSLIRSDWQTFYSPWMGYQIIVGHLPIFPIVKEHLKCGAKTADSLEEVIK